MKRILSLSLLAAASVAVVSCDQSKEDTSAIEQRLEELERGKIADQQRQQALEQELADQKIAREWEAIERERLQIAEAMARLDAQTKSDTQALAELEALKLRDAELANREAKASEIQADLIEERARLAEEKLKLDEQALALAGREAGTFAQANDTRVATVDYQFFNNALSPYGTWFETAEYGSVWQPAACADPSWRPYSRGHWVCSDRGWTWVSQEPFGWATYHYGRWAMIQGGRWIWVPGTEWAPSWCTWRSGDNHIGWAPLPPETLAYPNRGWDSRVETQYGIAAACYNFVDVRNFGQSVSTYCLPAVQNTSYFRITNNITNIKIVNQQVFCGGPSYREISKRLNRPIPYYEIERSHDSYDRPNQGHLRSQVRGGKLIVAAPRIERNEREAIRPNHRQVGIRIERNANADPEALNAYRQVRERELERHPAQPPTDRPVELPLAGVVTGREPRVPNLEPRPEIETGRPAIPVRPAPQPSIVEAESVDRPAMDRERTRPESITRPGRIPAGREQATDQEALARQAELQRQAEMREQIETAGNQKAELEAREIQAEELRRQAETARNEQTGRETRMRDEAQRKLRETAQLKETELRDRATMEARQEAERQLKDQQDVVLKQREDMRQKVETAQKQQAEQEATRRELAQQKLEQAAREKEQEGMREKVETGRRDRANTEARQQAERQLKEQQDAAQRQREDMRQKVEAAQKQQAEQEAARREQAAREKQQEEMRQQAEAARKAQAEEAARRQKEEAERAQRAEEQRKQMEEARRQQEEARRQQQEEQRRQQEEAQRKQQEEEQRRQQEEARRQQEEAQRRQQEEEQRRQQEEARRQQQEQQQQ